MSTELIGFIAAILTTAAFVPQVYKIVKLKSAEGISLTMYWIMFTGIVFWEIYGWLILSPPVILANIITASLLLIIIYYKLRYK
jgi:MtN3 and saliva related transmembrane protein